MDAAMLAQLAMLPPHLKLQILAATKQQQQQPESAGVAASTTADEQSFADAATDSELPLPFRLPTDETLDVSVGVASSSSSALPHRFLSRAMLRALGTHGFLVLDGFTDHTESGSSTDLTPALDEARGMYANRQMTHAGMKAAKTSVRADEASSTTADAQSQASWKSSALRGDHHKWLHAGDAAEREQFPHLHHIIDRIDALREELNEVLHDPVADELVAASGVVAADADSVSSSSATSRTGWHASRSLEAQVASYQGAGARYVAHRDAVVGQAPHRRLTCIVYLSDWKRVEQGGCLRLHLPAPTATIGSTGEGAAGVESPFVLPYFRATDTSVLAPPPSDTVFLPTTAVTTVASGAPAPVSSAPPAHVDLAPLANRCVIFASSVLLHEVRPAHELERFAITVWMQ